LCLSSSQEDSLGSIMFTSPHIRPLSLQDGGGACAALEKLVHVIEKNGGKLDWQHIEPETGEMLSCYWIEL